MSEVHGRGGRRAPAPVLPAVRRSWSLLDRVTRWRYLGVVLGQMGVGVLDLVGVALIGMMGLAATSAMTGQPVEAPAILSGRLPADWSDLQIAGALGLAAAAALLLRAGLFSGLLALNYRLLVRAQFDVIDDLWTRLLLRPVADVSRLSSQSISYALTAGASAAITNMLGSLSLILSDAALLVILAVGLVWVNPVAFVGAALYLMLVATLIHFSLSAWSGRVGSKMGRAGVRNTESVQEGLSLYRELFAMGRLGSYRRSSLAGLQDGAQARATSSLIAQIPRVVYDVALVVGALLLAAWQVSTSGAPAAMATILLFLAAASRVIPSLLRLNGQVLQIRFAAGQAEATYELSDVLALPAPRTWLPPSLDAPSPPDAAKSAKSAGLPIELKDVRFTYPGSTGEAVRGVSLRVAAGGSIALVGPTGAGKSTLVDLLVGVQTADSGRILIDGLPTIEVIATRPGSIAYVPQRAALISGTVRRNVAVGLAEADIDDALVWEALRAAHLDGVIENLPAALDAQVGEHGHRLSGGQRQRLGLARALYCRPQLLVLDEATSSLDGQTELAVTETLTRLAGRTTLVIIAHRLSAVKACDQVAYVEDGLIAGLGTFSELMSASEGFAHQVDILSAPAREEGRA